MLRTPLRYSPWLSEVSGTDVYVKIETLQPTFSFKVRGACNAVLRLVAGGGTPPPLVTASAGNHGRGLAYAARDEGLGLTVYVPENAPRSKLDAIRELGAELVPCRDYDEAEIRAKEHASKGEALFISPYAHPDVIAGAGTVGLEILEDQPDIDAIVVPIGGGGLISGIATAARALSRARIVGVELEASHALSQSLAAGRIVTVDVGPTLADGLGGNLDPDSITFEIIRDNVDRIVLVSEESLKDAVRGIAQEERIIVEGAGAAAAAAVLSGAARTDGKMAVVLSGGNIDLDKLGPLLTRTQAIV